MHLCPVSSAHIPALLLLVGAVIIPGSANAQANDLPALRHSAQANRNDAAAHTELGRALLRAGEYRDAERTLKRAATLHDQSIASLFDVARVAFAQGDYRKSRAACRPLERRHRGQSLTHVCRARAFLVWNRSGRAFEELEAATAAGGDHFEAHLALGDAHRLRADVAESEAAYRRAIALEGQRPEPHLGLGLLYANANRPEDAIRELRAALQRDPTDPEVQLELGRRLQGNEARELLTRATRGRPDLIDAQVALGDVELRAGNVDAAKAAYEAALAADRNSAAAHTGLGEIHLRASQHDEAMERFEKALALVPNAPHVVFLIGSLHEAKDDDQQAYEHYRRAAALAPTNPEALLAAAGLALRQNRDVLATGFLDNLLRTHPSSAAGLALYGDAMKARGDRAKAREYYQRALRGSGPLDRAAVEANRRAVSQQRRRRQGERIRNATRR